MTSTTSQLAPRIEWPAGDESASSWSFWSQVCKCANTNAFTTDVAPQQRAWVLAARHNGGEMLRAYLTAVYEDPTIGNSHVNVSQLGFFWSGVGRFGCNAQIWWACTGCAFPTNSMWAPYQDASLMLFISANGEAADQHGKGSPVTFPGFFLQLPVGSDDDSRVAGIPDDQWVEVMRISRKNDKASAADGCTVGQIWFWHAPGSGIWWNVGKARRVLVGQWVPKSMRTCSWAHEHGYDSMQFAAFYPAMALELIDCRGMRRSDAWSSWVSACPPAHIKLRAGIPQERFAPALQGALGAWSRPCTCDHRVTHINCLPASSAWRPAQPPPSPPWPSALPPACPPSTPPSIPPPSAPCPSLPAPLPLPPYEPHEPLPHPSLPPPVPWVNRSSTSSMVATASVMLGLLFAFTWRRRVNTGATTSRPRDASQHSAAKSGMQRRKKPTRRRAPRLAERTMADSKASYASLGLIELEDSLDLESQGLQVEESRVAASGAFHGSLSHNSVELEASHSSVPRCGGSRSSQCPRVPDHYNHAKLPSSACGTLALD